MGARSPRIHWHGTLVVVAIAILCCSPTSIGAQTLGSAFDRLRAPDRALLEVLRGGAERSATMRALVRRLELQQGVVYVTQSVSLSDGRGACLLHRMWGTGDARYLRILVRWGLPSDYLIALVAHELQHAVEVLEAPEIHDSRSMELFFKRIGVHNLGRYETSAAVDVQARVWTELRSEIGQRPLDRVAQKSVEGGIVQLLPQDGNRRLRRRAHR